MELSFSFEVQEIKEKIIDKTKFFFVSNGFNLKHLDENIIIFSRGSKFKNTYTFNPLKWKSDVRIEFIEPNKINGIINIDTSHQLLLNKEVDIWRNLYEKYENYIFNDEV